MLFRLTILFFCLFPHLSYAQIDTAKTTVDIYKKVMNQELSFKEGLALLDAALLKSIEKKDSIVSASLWNDKGNLYSKISDYNASYECYKKSLILYEQLNDHTGIGNCYINFARLSEQTDKQLFYYKKALQYFNKAQFNKGISRVYNNIGVSYEEANRLDSADYYFSQALYLAIEKKFPKTEAACLSNLGNIEIKKGNCSTALNYLDSAQLLFQQLQMPDGLIYSYGKKGEAYLCLHQQDSALFYLHQQYKKAKNIGLKGQHLEAAIALKNYHQNKRNYQDALSFANDALKLEQEIAEISKLEYADMLSYELSVQQKDRLLEQAAFQKELQNTKIIASSIAIFLTFIIILLIVYKQRNKINSKQVIVQQKEALIEAINEKHKQEIYFKNKEFRQLSNYILQKRDFIEILQKQLVILKRMKISKEATAKTTEILSLLNRQLNLSQDNEILQLNMQEIQRNFLLQLKDKYPKLSHGDVKLLSLLSLDLSSKDIAPIMGISVESVHTKRYRLRKKLNLASDISFNEFLQKMT